MKAERNLPTQGTSHHLAVALLKSAEQNDIDLRLLTGAPVSEAQWGGQDLLRLLRVVSQHTQDDFCGLASHPCHVEASLFATEIAVRSETLGEALRLAVRLYAMLSPGMRFALLDEGPQVAIEIATNDSARDANHFLVEWYAIFWYKLAQWLVGEEVPLESAEFPHPRQAKSTEYALVFGVTCRFLRPAGRIVFSRGFFARHVVRSPKDIDQLRSSADFDLTSIGDMERGWRGVLKAALRARLVRSQPLPTMEQLAAEFEVCSQTLRRRLRAEGISYRRLKAEARREVALDGISADRTSLSEASLMAGFTETNGLWLGRAE